MGACTTVVDNQMKNIGSRGHVQRTVTLSGMVQKQAILGNIAGESYLLLVASLSAVTNREKITFGVRN